VPTTSPREVPNPSTHSSGSTRAPSGGSKGAASDETDTNYSETIDLCGIAKVTEYVRSIYEAKASAQIICRLNSDPEAGTLAEANWWIKGALSSGEHGLAYRVTVGVMEDEFNGRHIWAQERSGVSNPANEYEIVSVNGMEAIWGADYALLMRVDGKNDLAVVIHPGYTDKGPIEAKPGAIAIAEEVESFLS